MANMAKTSFNQAERYAIFTAHGEKCWLCEKPVDFIDYEVDHIIPESLEGRPALAAILKYMGLPDDFDLDSWANLRPSHHECNRSKGAYRFKPTPMFQMLLDRGLEKTKHVQDLHDTFLSKRKLQMAFGRVLEAIAEKQLDPAQLKQLVEVAAIEHEPLREPEMQGQPLLFGPGLTVVAEDSHWITLRGPGGMVGSRPKGLHVHNSFDCPYCGPTGWNGTRCISCGQMIDPD